MNYFFQFSPLAWLYWDPSPYVVILPFVGIPLTWYGLLFAAGFWIGFHIFVMMFKRYLGLSPRFIEGDVDWSWLSESRTSELAKIEEGNLEGCNQLLKLDLSPERKRFIGQKGKLIEWCRQRRGELIARQLENRLLLEDRHPRLFVPLAVRAKDFAEKLILYVIVATIVGSRLGHILFYENISEYLANPLAIFKTWEGGLASHGGVLAIIFSLWLFARTSRKKYPDFSFFSLLDGIAIPTMLVASMIRLGNFFNQEILGTESNLPWAVVFGHPADGSAVFPRHPAQLYESLFYFGVFALLVILWKKYSDLWQPGRFAGIAIFASFTFRFFIEFFKTGQSVWFDYPTSLMFMGQLLSLPLSCIGLFLLVRQRVIKKNP